MSNKCDGFGRVCDKSIDWINIDKESFLNEQVNHRLMNHVVLILLSGMRKYVFLETFDND